MRVCEGAAYEGGSFSTHTHAHILKQLKPIVGERLSHSQSQSWCRENNHSAPCQLREDTHDAAAASPSALASSSVTAVISRVACRMCHAVGCHENPKNRTETFLAMCPVHICMYMHLLLGLSGSDSGRACLPAC